MKAISKRRATRSALAGQISPDTFIDMLKSSIWTDRNKGAAVLMELTRSRQPDLLMKLPRTALDSLIEMADGRDAAHAYSAHIILGRVAGIPEGELA